MDSTLLRVGEVATLLGVHPKTVRRWLKADQLPWVRLPGGERRVPSDAVQRVLSREGA